MRSSFLKFRYLLLVLLILIPSTFSRAHIKFHRPAHLKSHEKHEMGPVTELLQEKSQTTTLVAQDNQPTTNTDETDADSDSFFSVIGGVLLNELGDVNFYAAVILSFIYNPLFAIGAYLMACIATTLLAVIFIANLLVKLSVVAVSIVTALLFIGFAGMTAYYIYTMKDKELATEASVKKEGEGEADGEEGDSLINSRSRARQEEETKIFSMAGIKKIFNTKFVKARLFRFLFAAGILFVAQLGDDVLRKMVAYREDNGFVKVLLGSLIAFVIGGVFIGAIGLVIKEVLFRKLKINISQTKIVKYLGCGALVALGVVAAIIEL